MEASLTCAVCLGVFRDPVTLPLCSHNFCKSCVVECGEPLSRSLHFSIVDGGISVPAQVTCPLCRKVSCMPGGLSSLPINTTLAELVRLLSLSGGSREQGALCEQEAGYSEGGAGGRCPDHPEHKLELFCKNCAVPCCGKCVSCNHQGIFHNVNLLDMVYQEEKLIFFNSLKKLREIHERFTKNTDDAKNLKDTLRKNINIVNVAFEEVYKALDLKKKQCLEFIKQQQITSIKRHEVHKKAMAHHKVTVESLLQDCESLVDEFEPKCFLQAACSLNKRMTSNLDLMELASSHDQDGVNADVIHVDLKTVLDSLSAVTITARTSNVSQPKFNGISFKAITKIWKPEQAPSEKYSELRLKHYENLVIQETNGISLPDRQEQTLPNVEDSPDLGTTEANRLDPKICSSAVFLGACSTIRSKQETNVNTEPKMGIAQELQTGHKFSIYAAVRAKEPIISPFKGVAFGVPLDNKGKKETVVKTNQETIAAKAESKMEIAQEPQNDANKEAVFEFPSCAAVRAKKPVFWPALGVASGISLNKFQKGTEVFKAANQTKVVPSFCLGKPDAIDLSKPIKKGKSWKKPKTVSFLQTTANIEPFTSKPFTIFSNKMDSMETKVIDPFHNPFSQQECKAQGNENKSFPEDHPAQSNSCEEFYDAKSDAEETEEQTRPSTSTG